MLKALAVATVLIAFAGVADDSAIAFLEERTARDPDDIVAWNRLGDAYLRRLRTTGDHDHLDAAERCAEASLRAVPAEGNRGGLALLIRVRTGGHRFTEAKNLALELLALDPQSPDAWQSLGDAHFELGEYADAQRAYAKMIALGGVTVASETRLARLDVVHGRTRSARRRFETALRLAGVDAETRAWCEWQLGELAFAGRKHGVAERHYRAALAAFPESIPARGALARLAAARGDVAGAMREYERAIALDPVPGFLAALADLHTARGEHEAARALFARIEEGAADERDRRLDRRNLAMIYADHGIRLEDAYHYAKAEYAGRQDIYTADALAWCAFRSGRIDEARAAMRAALRTGSKDPRLAEHARVIARASNW